MIVRRLLNNSAFTFQSYAISPFIISARQAIRAAGEASCTLEASNKKYEKTANNNSDNFPLSEGAPSQTTQNSEYQITNDLKKFLLDDGDLCKECKSKSAKIIPQLENAIEDRMERRLDATFKEATPELERRFRLFTSLFFLSGLFTGFCLGRVGRSSKI
jgi:hypothetical protein